MPPVKGIDPRTGAEDVRRAHESAPLAALAFKIAKAPHIGHLTYLRVYSGTLQKNSKIFNATTGKTERVTRILRMHANRREDLDELCAGGIGAVIGLKAVDTGDTLSSEAEPIVLENITFPEPVISVSIEPKTKGDHIKMSEALYELSREDPTFRAESNQETDQTVISGMGELHIEIITDRLMREFNVDVKIGEPRVAFKETVSRTVESEGNYVKQSGGSGQFGKVRLRVSPLEPGEGFVFTEEVKGGEVPKEYFGAIKKGIEQAMKNGVLGNFPVIDVGVALLGGAFHEVDSNDMAFRIAASMGFKNALRKAHPILKEPIMKVEIIVPDEFVGNVMQDLSARRGRLAEMETRQGNLRGVISHVPLSEMFGYATALRNITQGRGDFSMEFHAYHQVPESLSETLIKKGA